MFWDCNDVAGACKLFNRKTSGVLTLDKDWKKGIVSEPNWILCFLSMILLYLTQQNDVVVKIEIYFTTINPIFVLYDHLGLWDTISNITMLQTPVTVRNIVWSSNNTIVKNGAIQVLDCFRKIWRLIVSIYNYEEELNENAN